MKPTHQGHQDVEENEFLDALVGTGTAMAIFMGIFLLITAIAFLVRH